MAKKKEYTQLPSMSNTEMQVLTPSTWPWTKCPSILLCVVRLRSRFMISPPVMSLKFVFSRVSWISVHRCHSGLTSSTVRQNAMGYGLGWEGVRGSDWIYKSRLECTCSAFNTVPLVSIIPVNISVNYLYESLSILNYLAGIFRNPNNLEGKGPRFIANFFFFVGSFHPK